jgi:5-methylcytosine-specific restriction endonuclease McrA
MTHHLYKKRKVSKKVVCTFCDKEGHTSIQCFLKKRTPLNLIAKKTNKRRKLKREEWFRKNPPVDGRWTCYLNISPYCPEKVTYKYLEIEHVYPRSSFPSMKWKTLNMKPSCTWCNSLKGSRSIESLAREYPHIRKMIHSPEWLEWKKKLFSTVKVSQLLHEEQLAQDHLDPQGPEY